MTLPLLGSYQQPHFSDPTLPYRVKRVVNVKKIHAMTLFYKYLGRTPDRQRSYYIRDKERDYAIFSLFLASGIRVNELADIRLRDVNFKKNRISIIRKGNKLDSIQVIPDAINDLKEYLQIRNERYGGSDAEIEYVFLSK